jgi:hypothetical protein
MPPPWEQRVIRQWREKERSHQEEAEQYPGMAHMRRVLRVMQAQE